MSPSSPFKRAILCRSVPSLLIIGSICPLASAQDFTRNVATADQFFTQGILPDNLAAIADPTFDGALKGVVGYSLSMGVNYDSNVNLSANNEEDDIFFNINPSAFYSSDPEGGARHAITAYYSPNPEFFRSETATRGSSSSFNHNGGVSYQFTGSRTSIGAFLNLSQASGSDRFTGGYSEGSIFSYGVSANYQLAPRTSIYGSLSSSYSTYETAGQQGSDFVSGSVGASWRATERLSFGPSVGGNWSESDNTGKTTTISLNFNGTYVATELIDLSASIGIQDTSYDIGGSDSGLRPTASLAFSYEISPIWNWSGSLSNANVPSPSTFGYVVNDWSVSTSLVRALDVGSISAFASYSLSTYDSAGFLAGPVPQDENYYQLGLSYGRPFFSDRISFSSSIAYLSSTGGTDWTKWIASFSWGTSF